MRTLHHPRRWLGCHPRPPEHAAPPASGTRCQDLLSELGAASLSARAPPLPPASLLLACPVDVLSSPLPAREFPRGAGSELCPPGSEEQM